LEALSDTVGTAHGVKVEVLRADLEKESDLGFVDVNRLGVPTPIGELSY
jgi:short-subunit dehydrogenase